MNNHCGIALYIKIVNRSNYNNQSAKIGVAAECKWNQETITLTTPRQNKVTRKVTGNNKSSSATTNNQQNNNQQNPASAAPTA